MPYKFNDLQLKWLAALESGDFKQARDALVSADGHCCLGVACEVAGVARRYNGYASGPDDRYSIQFIPWAVQEALKLRSSNGIIDGSREHHSLVLMNDVEKLSFADIAKFIRENPEKVFISED